MSIWYLSAHIHKKTSQGFFHTVVLPINSFFQIKRYKTMQHMDHNFISKHLCPSIPQFPHVHQAFSLPCGACRSIMLNIRIQKTSLHLQNHEQLSSYVTLRKFKRPLVNFYLHFVTGWSHSCTCTSLIPAPSFARISNKLAPVSC